jgi:hypothetical protein
MNIYDKLQNPTMQFPKEDLVPNADLKQHCVGRILQEYGSLFVQCKNATLKKSINHGHSITLNYNGNYYNFTLPKEYPFKPPSEILVNNISYRDIIHIKDCNMIPYLKKYTGESCFCCSSIFNKINWTPVSRISTIINEIEKNRIYKYRITMHVLCDEIRAKYNCSGERGEFAMFEDYLFGPDLYTLEL